MKISYYANKFFPSKAANTIQILSNCEALEKEGGNPILVAFRSSSYKDADDIFKEYGLDKFDMDLLDPKENYFVREIQMLKHAWNSRPDKMYTRSLFFSMAIKLIMPRKKVIYELHDFAKPWWFKFLVRIASNILDGIVVISDRLGDELAQRGMKNVHVLPDGVKVDKFQVKTSRKKAREKLGLPKNKILVLYTGNFHPSKGAHIFLDSMNYLSDSIKKKVVYVMVGGKSKEEIELMKKKSSPKKNFIFTGYKDHSVIPIYLKASDIAVLPNSAKENESVHHMVAKYYTSPMKLFEYMAAGKPIIASDVPSLREILNSKNAIFFTPDNPEDLARNLINLIEDYKKKNSISRKAYKDSLKYDWKERVKSIMGLFR